MSLIVEKMRAAMPGVVRSLPDDASIALSSMVRCSVSKLRHDSASRCVVLTTKHSFRS